MAYWGDDLFSSAFADQTQLDAEHASPTWVPMRATRFDISPARDIEVLETSRSSDMVADERAVGGAWGGTLSFSVPLRGQSSTYDATADGSGKATTVPVANPEITMLADVIGSTARSIYRADEISSDSQDANTWDTDGNDDAALATLIGAGQLCADAATGAIRSFGWVKSYDATTNAIEMFEDGIAAPTTDDHLVPCLTLYASGTGSTITPRTMRQTGSDSTQDVRAIGWYPTGATIAGAAGKQPTIEFSGEFASPLQFNTSGGGLLSATAYQTLPPIMGLTSGRLWIDSTSNGTLETTGTTGIGDFSVELGVELAPIPSHSATWGTSDIAVRRRTCRASFFVPYASSWVVGGVSKWSKSLDDGDTFSISLQSGNTIGKFFAMLIPAAKVVDVETWGSGAGGTLGWTVTVEPAEYTGDTGSGNACNSPFRLCFG